MTIRVHPNAPAFRILLGWSGVGEAWEARSRGEHPRNFLRVELDGPLLPAPMHAALFTDPDDGSAVLVWDRDRQRHRLHDRANPRAHISDAGPRHEAA